MGDAQRLVQAAAVVGVGWTVASCAAFQLHGQEFVDRLGGMVRQFGEDEGEQGLRIDVVQLAAVDERIDCGGATAAPIRSSKCPITSSDCYTTQGAFGSIVKGYGTRDAAFSAGIRAFRTA